jgi:hypothetical protein
MSIDLNKFNPLLASATVEVALQKEKVGYSVRTDLTRDLTNCLANVDKDLEAKQPKVLTAKQLRSKMENVKFFSKPSDVIALQTSVTFCSKQMKIFGFPTFFTAVIVLIALPILPLSIAFGILTGVLGTISLGSGIAYAIKKYQYDKEIKKAAEFLGHFKLYLQHNGHVKIENLFKESLEQFNSLYPRKMPSAEEEQGHCQQFFKALGLQA